MNLVQMADLYISDERRRNPSSPQGEATSFLRALSEAGEMRVFSTAEWIDAGRRFGLTDNEITAWMEDGASWLVDTSDYPSGLEPAAWTGLQ